jgi:Tfp pilus assembly protein PilE
MNQPTREEVVAAIKQDRFLDAIERTKREAAEAALQKAQPVLDAALEYDEARTATAAESLQAPIVVAERLLRADTALRAAVRSFRDNA